MMHVGCGSDGCLRDGIRSCERRTNAAVADERGLHTRPGDPSSSARGFTNASPKPCKTPPATAAHRPRHVSSAPASATSIAA